MGCRSLTTVYIPTDVRSIGNSAFFNCSGLVYAEIAEGTETIGNLAFTNCGNLRSVVLPASLTRIGDAAFHTYSVVEYRPNMDITFTVVPGSFGETYCSQYGFKMQ